MRPQVHPESERFIFKEMSEFGIEFNSFKSPPTAPAMDVPARAYPPVLLFCHPSMEPLAKKIVASVAESVSAYWRAKALVPLGRGLSKWLNFIHIICSRPGMA